SWKRESGAGARTRIQAGFASFSRGKNFRRAVFSAPFSLNPASRTFEHPGEEGGEPRAKDFLRIRDAEIARLRDLHSGITAGIDLGERREVHVDVEREAVVRAAARNADAERGDLGPG